MVDRLVGIPVSVGLAPTKTLAKLASERAKKTEAGVLEITEGNRPEILANTSVGDVWGIGPKASEKLTRRGMSEAADFTNMNPVNVKKLFSFCGNDSQFNILQDYE
jgi:DNA polymerase V